MNRLFTFLLILFAILVQSTDAVSQVEQPAIHVFFIKDFSAKDYYTLLESDPEVTHFEIVEACIPAGFIAIKYDNSYPLEKSNAYTQTLLLKLIDKNAGITAYSLEDLRDACALYRKNLSNE